MRQNQILGITFGPMADQPLITVVTPTWNFGSTIERTIQSVLEQKFESFEHIVLDARSTDNTLEILQNYPHLKWFSEADDGQSDAVNKGLKMARGKYLTYINSDDYFFPGIFRRVVEAFEKNSPDIVYGDTHYRYSRRGQTHEFVFRSPLFSPKEFWKNCFLPQPGIFWKREIHDDCGYFNTSLHYIFDYKFFLRCSKTKSFHRIDHTNASFCFSDYTKTGSEKQKLNSIAETRRIIDDLFEKGFAPEGYEGHKRIFLVSQMTKKFSPFTLYPNYLILAMALKESPIAATNMVLRNILRRLRCRSKSREWKKILPFKKELSLISRTKVHEEALHILDFTFASQCRPQLCLALL